MRNLKSIILILFVSASCENGKMTPTEREGEPNIYSLASDDHEINAVISKAKNTLVQFDEALQNNKINTSNFALKVKFPTETGAEHIWVTSIKLEKGNYYGVVDNLPSTATQIRFGEKIKLDKDDITDWIYSENGVLRGGYTIRLIRSRMSEQERKQFDAEFPFKIEN